MENTLNNKAIFFALYYRQFVYIDHTQTRHQPFSIIQLDSYFVSNGYLRLKSIKNISIEEAKDLMRIILEGKGLKDEITSIVNPKKTLDGYTFIVKYKNYADEVRGFIFNGGNPLQFYDYLRSKGYALPFNGLSLSTLVEYGWLKIIQ